MSIKTAIPYLNLRGKAAEATELYKSALGAEVEFFQRFGEAMHDCPEAMKDQVMHASLKLGDATLYLSDGSPDEQDKPGGTVTVALDFETEARAHAAYDALAAGGKAQQPLFDAPWGQLFGACQDRYGINWMITADKA